jgi:flagellar biosynthesis protein FlhF
MEVKKYRTKSIHEAICKIKKDLGPDAMILSTKRVSKKKSGRLGRDCFEVSAFPGGQEVPKDTGSFFHETNSQNRTSRLDAMQHDIVGIKDMLYLLNETRGIPGFFQEHPECLNLYAKLIKSGISEEWARQLLIAGCNDGMGRETSPREITKRVLMEVQKSISVFNPFAESKKQRTENSFVGFVGPTGVGKTTTIAKLAADLHLKQKKKVGLISIDNYRIGAVEQLKTYAAIIGIPFVTAFSLDDLGRAVNKMQSRDVVLIDTAGMSHLDAGRLKEMAALLYRYPEISTQLVLSATTRSLDMKEIVDHFSIVNPKSYVFTKLDETRRCGGIIDQVLNFRLPVSFITNGQKVPEDIVEATKRGISRMVLNI